jgi:hypothetical protein
MTSGETCKALGRAFVFRPERDSFFLHILTEIGAQLNIRGGFPTGGCSCFYEHTVSDFTETVVDLVIGDPK